MNTARLTRNEIETLSTAVGLTPNSRPIVGRAVFTIVTSMIDMNIAATKTVPTTTFWLMRACTRFLFCGRLPSAATPVTRARVWRKQRYQIVSILSINGRAKTVIPAEVPSDEAEDRL